MGHAAAGGSGRTLRTWLSPRVPGTAGARKPADRVPADVAAAPVQPDPALDAKMAHSEGQAAERNSRALGSLPPAFVSRLNR